MALNDQLNLLINLTLPDDVSTYAMRQTGAADETVIWFFDGTEYTRILTAQGMTESEI